MGFGIWGGGGGYEKRLYRGGAKEKKILGLKRGGHQKIPLSDALVSMQREGKGSMLLRKACPWTPYFIMHQKAILPH